MPYPSKVRRIAWSAATVLALLPLVFSGAAADAAALGLARPARIRGRLRGPGRHHDHEHGPDGHHRRPRPASGQRDRRLPARDGQRRQARGRRCRPAGRDRPDDRVRRRRRTAVHGELAGRPRRADPHRRASTGAGRSLARADRARDARRAGRPARGLHLPDPDDADHRDRQQRPARQRRPGVQRLLAGRQLRDARNQDRVPGQHPGVDVDLGERRRDREGRLLARTGAVTLINDTVTRAQCAAGTEPPPRARFRYRHFAPARSRRRGCST